MAEAADPGSALGPPEAASLDRTDTAASAVIRAESVAIPTPAWGTALEALDTEVVIAELIEDDEQTRTAPSGNATAAPSQQADSSATPRPTRPRWLGIIALVLAVFTILFHALAVGAANARAFDQAEVHAWIAIGCSIAGIAIGTIAVPLRAGRLLGALGAVVSLLANPWVLLQVLRAFE